MNILSLWPRVALLLVAAVSAFAAPVGVRAEGHATISYEKVKHDFGTISERDGDVTYAFRFTNTGSAPLLIVRAQASCGCTTPEYPKEPIRPGESGAVTVTYHTKGRPGAFQKSIYVYDNSSPNHRTTLIITGNVISSRTPEETYTKVVGGGLRLKNRSLSFFDVYPTRDSQTRTFDVYNESDEPIQLSFKGMPKHIYVESEPQIIEPRREGKILVTYYANRVKDWGLRKDYFKVFVKGKEAQMKDNDLSVTADITEDFSRMSKKERASAPAVVVTPTALDFGKTQAKKELSVTIGNEGLSKLLVRKVQNSEPRIFATEVSATTLRPGETATLRITFDPAQCRLASMNHHVTLISNDPANPRIIINMTAGK